uniref:Chitin-binding type-2 domain-containing protein n=1 Tax=Timema poppense TaxID=170557 RepID=A0A7R9D9S4_TIMPO|nr:unnamed protein product [Timema poppensis]
MGCTATLPPTTGTTSEYSQGRVHSCKYDSIECSGGLHELHTCKDHLHYSHESQSCGQSVCHAQENGLYSNYSLDCHEYYRCENQRLAESFTCGPDNTFSAAERLCLPSGEVVCVEPHCDYNSSGYFVLPATRCQAYYSCEHGTAIHHLCPYNTVFDVDRQLCVEGGVVCYEPLCTGRVNGLYPDTSHGCRRTFECLGGSIRAVFSCPTGQLHDGRSCSPADTVSCPSVSTTSVALYSGDCVGLMEGTTWAPARDCSAYHVCKSGRVFATMRCSRGLRYNGHKCVDQDDVPCHSYCSNHTDGPHVDLDSRCHEYFFCEKGEVLMRRKCSKGTLYNGRMCVPSKLYTCPLIDGRLSGDECFSLLDGTHRDTCRSYMVCANGAVVSKHFCPLGYVWDGFQCVLEDQFPCEGPSPWTGCVSLDTGLYQDVSPQSRCRQYYHCLRENRTRFTCPNGTLFDGKNCVSFTDYECPSVEADSCDYRPDGYYRDPNTGCRSYFYCSNRHKITYVCSGSYVFNGEECVHLDTYKCPFTSEDCVNKYNGYHHDTTSGCWRYFYCLDSEKIATFTCDVGKVFDGARCVDAYMFKCPATLDDDDACFEKSDGWYPDPSADCRRYFQCRNWKKVSINECPEGRKFDGFSCVDSRMYEGCTSSKVIQDLIPSLDCSNTLNGFYQNLTSNCSSYYFCIDGTKTSLKCSGGKLFNGELCVDANTYTCPVPNKQYNRPADSKQAIKTNYQNYSILYVILYPTFQLQP